MRQITLRRGLVGLAVAILLVQLTISAIKPTGDFLLHHTFAGQLWKGAFLYEAGDNPYPPAFAVAYAPFALVTPHLAKPLLFLVSLSALIALGWMLNDLTRRDLPLPAAPWLEGKLFLVWAGTVFIASRFITRDFDDAGQNILLMSLTWAGVWLFFKQRVAGAGAALGLAIALKATAGVVLAYFLLKRQWKMAASTVAWTVVFSLTPVLWMGWNSYVEHVWTWSDFVITGARQPDPSVGMLGNDNLQNRALRPSLARYLMVLPEGHPGRAKNSAYVDFLDLSPASAGLIIKAIMLIGVLALAWRFRRPLPENQPLVLAWEVSIMCLVALLYSPITWTQHCVAAVPLLYLLLRSHASGMITSRWLPVGLAAFLLLILGTNRSFITRDGCDLMDSYRVVTFAIIGLIGIGLAYSPKPAPVATANTEILDAQFTPIVNEAGERAA